MRGRNFFKELAPKMLRLSLRTHGNSTKEKLELVSQIQCKCDHQNTSARSGVTKSSQLALITAKLAESGQIPLPMLIHSTADSRQVWQNTMAGGRCGSAFPEQPVPLTSMSPSCSQFPSNHVVTKHGFMMGDSPDGWAGSDSPPLPSCRVSHVKRVSHV